MIQHSIRAAISILGNLTQLAKTIKYPKGKKLKLMTIEMTGEGNKKLGIIIFRKIRDESINIINYDDQYKLDSEIVIFDS